MHTGANPFVARVSYAKQANKTQQTTPFKIQGLKHDSKFTKFQSFQKSPL
jgi:hypothetical protein